MRMRIKKLKTRTDLRDRSLHDHKASLYSFDSKQINHPARQLDEHKEMANCAMGISFSSCRFSPRSLRMETTAVTTCTVSLCYRQMCSSLCHSLLFRFTASGFLCHPCTSIIVLYRPLTTFLSCPLLCSGWVLVWVGARCPSAQRLELRRKITALSQFL